ncbi:Transcription factor bye1 [Rhodotorula kratochvilovae]
MSRRQRKPTIRALEAAQTALALRTGAPASARGASSSVSSTPRPGSPASSVASVSASAAPVKRNGRAVNARGAQAVAKELARNQAMQTEDDDDEDSADADEGYADLQQQQDMTLYCVCLGYDTGEQPMIQCEHCSNWFHFSCVSLTDDIAGKIEAYSCDMCEQMGMGATRLLADAPARTTSSIAFYAAANEDLDDAPSDDGEDDEEETDEEDEDFDEDADVDEGRSKGKGKEVARGRKRKTDLVVSDDDFDGELDDDVKPKKKKDVKPVLPTASVPTTDKTRTHVVKQLTTIFSSIFSAAAAGSGESGSAGMEVRSAAFAEEVEGELFEGFAEVDDKGVRGPRAKYVAKFRSLHFNLKSNAYLRSRVANNELGAGKLIHLSAEDLQTPELRAMAESVRAASLRNSVKEVLAAPTAKRTHKGEEEIDNEASQIIAAELAERAKEEQQKMEAVWQKKKDERDHAAAALQSPLDAAFAESPFASGSPRAHSPDVSHDSSATGARHRLSLGAANGSPAPADGQGSPAGAASPGSARASGSPAPTGTHRGSASNFDMASIWTKAKAASPPVEQDGTPAPADADKLGEAPPTSDDPFDLTGHKTDESGDEDFEDALFRAPGASPSKSKARAPKPPSIDELPPVWAGDFIVPEEGGFPSFAVQVGGRPLGTAAETWKQLLGRGLTTAGRLPTPTAKKYLVECALAPTRELVVLALLPDLTGPSADFPHKPTRDSCLAKHQHIVEQYVRRDRVGVVQAPRELAKLVKDIYIVPLRKDADVPEYVELTDEHAVPPRNKRENDLVLAVLVVQKGVLPTVKAAPLPATTAPAPVPAPAPVIAPPAFSPPPPAFPQQFGGSPFPHQPPPPAHQLPYSPSHAGYSPLPPAQGPSFGSPPPPAPPAAGGFDPATMQSLLAQVNPDTLNSLLANPALLNSLPGFAASAQGTPPPPETAPRGPPVHPSRLAMMSASPPPPPVPAGPAAMQQPYGATSDGGWGARSQQQQQGGYAPQQGGGYGGGVSGYGY